LAKEIGISQSQVCKILKKADLKPHKTEYWCGKSTDPEFEKKALDIIGLYLSPPQNALILSVDEKTQIQALDRTQPELPLMLHYLYMMEMLQQEQFPKTIQIIFCSF